MEVTSISQLKASLSRYLGLIKRGEEVLITERGRVIAKLISIKKSEISEISNLHALEKAGLIRLNKDKIPKEFWDFPRIVDKGNRLRRALLEERRESL